MVENDDISDAQHEQDVQRMLEATEEAAWEDVVVAARSGNLRPAFDRLLQCVLAGEQPPPRALEALLNLPTGQGRRTIYEGFMSLMVREMKPMRRAVQRYKAFRSQGLNREDALARAAGNGVTLEQLRTATTKSRY
jgi:hypothetical protein